tara:strand:- start:1212 stop:1364 length:153 start_codon:yes stop_codon:yes gene_type:complete
MHAIIPSYNEIGFFSVLPSFIANCFGLPHLNLWNYSERYKNKKPHTDARV